MALPHLIEIVPLDKPVRAEITVPGSKSITNRALILAALADGEFTLYNALWSEDTQIMFNCLKKLDFDISRQDEPEEFCNKTITVKGLGGKIPNGGTAEKPLELFVGNAGTAARFLSAFVCLGNGVYRLSGDQRMHERPQAELFEALRKLDYRIESENGNDKLPVKIFGSGPKKEKRIVKVSIKKSSQFASALLLCEKVGNWEAEIEGENAEESPYVAMTKLLIEKVNNQKNFLRVEPDASSASYFWGKGWLFPLRLKDVLENKSQGISIFEGSTLFPEETVGEQPLEQQMTFSVNISRWPKSGWQIDERFSDFLQPPPAFPKKVSRTTDLGDSIMTAIVLAPFASEPCKFTDLERLRYQECERVVALRTELSKLVYEPKQKIIERGNTLEISPCRFHNKPIEIETYNDHRMAMCFAILGLKVPGIKIKNPACVMKTFPNFFQKLAAQPKDGGLGATILDAKSGRKLTHEELFAD
jgi:3-phosphoshikimate 1-carboxyvinyltransferase